MFAPPPQPQSRIFASGAALRKRSPQSASALCPMFIMDTISFPPRPSGLRVFSKNDISLASRSEEIFSIPVKRPGRFRPCFVRCTGGAVAG